jgi:hypothetical protein
MNRLRLQVLGKTLKKWLGIVAQSCNPNCLGGRDQEYGGSWQKVPEIPSQPMTGHGGIHLSSQLLGKYKLDCGPVWSRHTMRTLSQK